MSLNSSLPFDFNDSKLFLLHLNIRSLSKNFDNLIKFLTNVPLRPHIISLTETKIKDMSLVNITISGYTFLHVNSVSNFGGMGIYVSDLLQFKRLSFEVSFSGSESIWINFTYPGTDINYVVGTVYRHPNSNADDFMEFLNDNLTKLNLYHKRFFVFGDMNINTYKRTHCRKDYLNLLSSNCATNIIDVPTRVTTSSATVLDHIITNQNKHQIFPAVVDYDITDHYPVMALVNNKLIHKNVQPKFARSFAKFNSDSFNNDLQKEQIASCLRFSPFRKTMLRIYSMSSTC